MLDMFKNPGAAFSPGKKAPAAIPTARKMLKYVKNAELSCWTCSKNRERTFPGKKNACGNTHSESNAQKYTITHTETHLGKYPKTFGQIHNNIWRHAQEHLETYTNTFGNIHNNIWKNTQTHLETYTNTHINLYYTHTHLYKSI